MPFFDIEAVLNLWTVCKDEIEFPLYMREHVALQHFDVLQSMNPAVLLSILDGWQADINGYDLSSFWRTEYKADTAPAAEIQHPVALAAILTTGLLVLERLVDVGQYYKSLSL